MASAVSPVSVAPLEDVTLFTAGSTTGSVLGTIDRSSVAARIVAVSTADETVLSASGSGQLGSDTIDVSIGSALTPSTSASARAGLDLRRNTSTAVYANAPWRRLAADVPPASEPEVYDLRRHLQRAGNRSATSPLHRPSALGVSVGAQASLWAKKFDIGSSAGIYLQVPATLKLVTAHAHIWIDDRIAGEFAPAQIQQIGDDFENAYASDTAHFASPDYTTAAAGNQGTYGECNADGSLNGQSEPLYIDDTDPHVVVFIVSSDNVGGGLGGYFNPVNFYRQGVLNCYGGSAQSNEVPMIYDVWPQDGFMTVDYELQEDLVRGTAHELQHLINFVNKNIDQANAGYEQSWLNEGLSMLAQDFAVHRMFPGVPLDLADAVGNHGAAFLRSPQSFSLTAFTGIDPGEQTPAYNCGGCYGASYLFQRYLYDRFGGDAYTHAMETSARTGTPNVEAATGQAMAALMEDFAVAIDATGTGLTDDPAFLFKSFNPYGTYADQFGNVYTFTGPATIGAPQAPGAVQRYTDYLGSFLYVDIAPLSSHGAPVTILDPAELFAPGGGIVQH